MDEGNLDLSIIIVNWNTRDMLAECLATVLNACAGATLEAQGAQRPLAQRSLKAEVILVDNASSDGSAGMVAERFPEVRLVRNAENIGFSKANNQAIRLSQGRYALLLNTDAFIDAPSLEALVRVMEAHPEIGIAGPRLVYPDGSPQVSHSPLPTLRSETLSLFGLDKRTPQANGEAISGEYVLTGYVEGASLLARKEALERVGYMDEGFYFFSEEVDLCGRVTEAGWKVVYVPGTRVVHVRGGSTGATPRRVALLYRAKLQYFEKHGKKGDRERLLQVMRIATKAKRAAYSLLGVFSKSKADRAALWAEVDRALEEEAAHPPGKAASAGA